MRVVYMGTPEFAVPPLRALAKDGMDVAAVVTAPDRRQGRGRKTAPPPVKVEALDLNLPVIQVDSLKTPDILKTIHDLAPDFLAVVAFGYILPPALLAVPRHMSVNVHPSLLPRYQGPAPIQWAVLNGDAETGVTTMAMDPGVDTGGILMQARVPVKPEETSQTLHDRLSLVGAGLLVETLHGVADGRLSPTPQDPARVEFAPRLSKTDGEMDWSRTAGELDCFVRGMNPWPGAFTFYEGNRIKIHRARVSDQKSGAPAGTVLAASRKGLLVATGQGVLNLLTLQAAGGKPLAAGDFLLGKPIVVGDRLGR